jgi:hypothetical protein
MEQRSGQLSDFRFGVRYVENDSDKSDKSPPRATWSKEAVIISISASVSDM